MLSHRSPATRAWGWIAVAAFPFLATTAFAFEPVDRPWPSTPMRFFPTMPEHKRPRVGRAAKELGLSVVSYRANGSPALLWGATEGPSVPLSVNAAEETSLGIARQMAPDFGILPEDLFVLGSTPLDGWMTVTLGQTVKGIKVDRGVLVFAFRDGKLLSIRNDLALDGLERTMAAHPAIDAARATQIAQDAALGFAKDSAIAEPAELEVWTSGDLLDSAVLAYRVHTRSMEPRSELTFHVDARTGEILAADDDVHYANGEGRVRLTVDPINAMTAMPVPFTAKFIGLGGMLATDGDGDAVSQSPARATYTGPYVTINDMAGALEQLTINFGGPFHVIGVTPMNLSEADPFVHLNIVHEFVRQVTPTMQWLGQRLTANINLQQTCNAFWDGRSVNFFSAGGGCNNTGRISSIVYHEFGHGVHQHLTQNIDGTIGEGTGDFLSASTGNDPIIGRGFSNNGGGIRRLDQPKVYPTNIVNEIHADGLIWATSLWELRTALIQKHGEGPGRKISARMFALALTQGPTLQTAYPAIISGDADGMNPTMNGTPNSCEINRIFQAHGLINGGRINNTQAATRPFVRINHDPPGRLVRANGSVMLSATAENRSMCGMFSINDLRLLVAPGLSGGTFSPVPLQVAGQMATATLSDFASGDSFRYYYEITAGGGTFRNGTAATPHIAFVALDNTVEISREGFEMGLGGWTHGTIMSDLTDDWEVGAPLGLAQDPFDAHGGMKVAGTDLGGGGGPAGTDGVAKAGRKTFFEAPPVDTTGKENIRLELWQSYAINGKLRILVDGREVWTYTNDGTGSSGGWRFVSVALGDGARDNPRVVVRFEVEAAPNNALGGWTIDDVAVTGVAIPPPPPPPMMMPPPTMMPPPEPKDPSPGDTPAGDLNRGTGGTIGTTPGGGGGSGPQVGTSGPEAGRSGGEQGTFTGGVGGGCRCVPVNGEKGAPSALAIVLASALWFVRRRRS